MYSLRRRLQKLNWYVIGNMMGYVLIAEGVLLFFPMMTAAIYHEDVGFAYLFTMLFCFVIGIPLGKLRVKHKSYFAKDGMLAVGLCWIAVSLVGAIPFYLTKEIPSYVDCFFETVSGFTTTGSSILTDIEALSHGSLFWRSFTHWVGGMGVLVFVLAFLPKSNEHTMHIMRAEVPGPTIGKLVPRLKQSAMILYEIYMVMTIIEIILLMIGGMPLFDAIVNSFGTAGTGGFAIKNLSIGQYNNLYYEIVITVFMLLFGINFNMYYFLTIRDFKQIYKNEELRTYIAIVLGSMLMIALNIRTMYGSFLEALRYSSFQVASIITTTGYSSCNFDLWPSFSKMILFLLMILGACAGSTGGGLKVSRFLILAKKAKLDLQRLMHPQKVEALTMDGKVVDEEIVNQVLSYFATFMLISALCLFIVSLDNLDMETTISSVFACIGNIGPGFGLCGAVGNFSMFSNLSKITLSAAMLIGRLEIYPILIFVLPFIHAPKIKHKDKS